MKDFFELREGNKSELTEAPNFMKMSKELLKHKDKGIEYEKAAAYIRAIHNNSNVNVQDKAFMGLTKMLKDMDDFTKRTTITKILKDNGFKVKGGRLMRESAELDEQLYAPSVQTKYGIVTVSKRDTKGMRGKQDGFKLTLKTKSGKTVDLGSHPRPTDANIKSIAKNVMEK